MSYLDNSGQFGSATYRVILDRLDAAIAWLRALGAAVDNTRIQAYRAQMLDLYTHLENGTLQQIVDPDPVRSRKQVSRIMWLFHELGDLDMIYSALSQIDITGFEESIRGIALGPEWRSGETDGSMRARSTAIELIFAARCALRGLPIMSLPPTDFAIRLNDKVIAFECKRPRSKRAIPRAIKDGFNQVRARCGPGGKADRGIVAIDISMAFNPDGDLFDAVDEQQIESDLGRIADECAASLHDDLRPARHKKALGIYLRFVGMCVNRRVEHGVYCQQYALVAAPEIGSEDFRLMKTLADTLGG
jgi:hypothetical protein